MSDLQKNIFVSKEADKWFERNKRHIQDYNSEQDPILVELQAYNIKPKSILEIGCSTGYRLEALHSGYQCKCYGIEPSVQAIDFAQKLFPSLNLSVGTADDMSIYSDNTFDLIIINFVLHWVDRGLLFKVISEIDRVLKNDGILIIGDFFPNVPTNNKYHHVEEEVYTYKQNYEDVFLASNLYRLISKKTLNHQSKSLDISNEIYNRFYISTLKKDNNLYHKNPIL